MWAQEGRRGWDDLGDYDRYIYTLKVTVLVDQSCLTLCSPRDCRPPGSSVHGILQARILEWVAVPFK